MKQIIFIVAFALIIIAGCKDEKQSQYCACSSTYSEYFDSDSTSAWGISIPNIFTPNGDSVNDFFWIYGKELDSVSIVVKDRDSVVFTSNSLAVGWDGTIKTSALLRCGDFNYIVDVKFVNGITRHYENTITVFTKYGLCVKNISKCRFGSQYNPLINDFDLNRPSKECLSGC